MQWWRERECQRKEDKNEEIRAMKKLMYISPMHRTLHKTGMYDHLSVEGMCGMVVCVISLVVAKQKNTPLNRVMFFSS